MNRIPNKVSRESTGSVQPAAGAVEEEEPAAYGSSPTGNAARTPLRLRLRQATADAHRQTEQQMAVLADLTTAQGYGVYLRTMLRLHTELNADLAQVATACGLCDRNPALTAALRADLAGLARTPALRHNQRATSRPAPPAVPERLSLPVSFGRAYVMEGSALGAQLLRRRLLSAGGPQPLAYLSLLSEDHGQRWRAFCDALNALSQIDVPSVCLAAQATFARVAECLAEEAS